MSGVSTTIEVGDTAPGAFVRADHAHRHRPLRRCIGRLQPDPPRRGLRHQRRLPDRVLHRHVPGRTAGHVRHRLARRRRTSAGSPCASRSRCGPTTCSPAPVWSGGDHGRRRPAVRRGRPVVRPPDRRRGHRRQRDVRGLTTCPLGDRAVTVASGSRSPQHACSASTASTPRASTTSAAPRGSAAGRSTGTSPARTSCSPRSPSAASTTSPSAWRRSTPTLAPPRAPRAGRARRRQAVIDDLDAIMVLPARRPAACPADRRAPIVEQARANNDRADRRGARPPGRSCSRHHAGFMLQSLVGDVPEHRPLPRRRDAGAGRGHLDDDGHRRAARRTRRGDRGRALAERRRRTS